MKLPRWLGPIERFLQIEAASGIVLLVAAASALVWANSPLRASYAALFRGPRVQFAINDVLMVIFFFLVGLEIRRELHAGELAEPRRAALPVAAALGGMFVPAAIFFAINTGQPGRRGFGVPMATDIAFAVGALTLLGKRVPAAIRVLLLALAIIDDIGAIFVIAIFYSTAIIWSGLAIAVAGLALIALLKRFGMRHPLPYLPVGAVVWYGVLRAGIHPTIAGVALGLMTSPKSEGLQHALHPWVAYGIMPIFALANAGVALASMNLGMPGAPGVALGVIVGLVVGKPIGIVAASFIATRLGIASMPRGVTLTGVLLVGIVAGIGFTMALFIAELAFAGSALLHIAKAAVLAASCLAALLSLALGPALLARGIDARALEITETEAERSTEE